MGPIAKLSTAKFGPLLAYVHLLGETEIPKNVKFSGILPETQHYLFDWFPPMLLFTTPLSLSLCQDVLLSHYCRLEVSNPGGVGEVKRWLARQGLQVAVEYCSLCSSLSGAEVSPSCGIPVGTSWTGLPSFCDTKIAVLRYKISTYASYASRRSFSRRDTEDGSFLYSFSDPDAGAEKKSQKC